MNLLYKWRRRALLNEKKKRYTICFETCIGKEHAGTNAYYAKRFNQCFKYAPIFYGRIKLIFTPFLPPLYIKLYI